MLVFRFVVAITVVTTFVNAWVASRLHSFKRVEVSEKIINPNAFHSPIQAMRRITNLRFKVSETDDVDVVKKEEIIFDDYPSPPTSTTPKKRSIVLDKIQKGIIPVAASLGFALTPSSSIGGRIAGAAVGGVAGLVARNIISKIDGPDRSGDGDSKLPTEVLSAIKRLKAGPPIFSQTIESLEELARDENIAEDDLTVFFTHVFAEALYTGVYANNDLTELQNVVDFAIELEFSEDEIGDGFAIAALMIEKRMERDEDGFYSASFGGASLEAAARVFFLADKLIGKTDGYYGKRLATALSFFTEETYKGIITAACTKLFKRCIQGVLSDPSSFTNAEIETYQKFLSAGAKVSEFRPASMQSMVVEALNVQLDHALGRPNAPIGDLSIDAESLQKSKLVLGWSNREFDATIETRTLPVFETVVRTLAKEVLETPSRAQELSHELSTTMMALNIDSRKSRIIATNIISEQNAEYMNKIERVYTIAGKSVQPAFNIMSAYAKDHKALETLFEPALGNASTPIPGLPFAETVRANLYEIQLLKGAKKTAVSEDMFALDEEQQELVKRSLALPKVSNWIAQCLRENNYADDAKNAYRKQLEQYGVSDKEWASTAVDFYYQEASRVASLRAVPSAADMEFLTKLKNFLGCSDENAALVNLELLGDKYMKALTEAMTPTGVITEEYLDGLERLRARLGLTETDAKTLLGVAARGRLENVIKDIVDIWLSDTDATKRREIEEAKMKKKGGDPIDSLDNMLGYVETGAQKYGGGPNVFMREALNLVNFFTENYLSQGADLSAIESFPVTAVGAVNTTDLLGVFKHYITTRLTEADAKLRKRYEQDERVFAMVLGIPPASQVKVKESLSYTVFKNMLKNVLRSKDGVDKQDLQQVAFLKEELGLEKELAEKIYDKASRDAVMEHAVTLFRTVPEGEFISAEVARRFRQQVQSMDLDMRSATGFNDKLVTYLYSLEVQYMVENGLEDEFAEAQEAYDIPEDRAAVIVDSCCQRYISQTLNLALRDAKKYNEPGAVEWTQKIVIYSQYVSSPVDADGNVFTEDDKDRLISFYENSIRERLSGEDATEVQAEAEAVSARLKTLINITDKFVAPVDGIDGLLGKLSGMQAVGDGEQKWAWSS